MIDQGTCHVCDEDVPVDGEHAMERFGDVLCRDCSDEPVVFEAECTNGFCDWSYRYEDVEFNRGHVETRVRSEANTHENRKQVFDDDPAHTTEVWEVEPDEVTA
jgi:hypothetical protein